MRLASLVSLHSQEIAIPDTDPDVFELFLEYIYTDAVGGLLPEKAVDLYVLGTFYGVEKLRDICSDCVKRGIDSDNAASLLQRAHDAMCSEIKSVAMNFVITKFDTVSKGAGISALSHPLLLEVLSARP